LREVRVEKVYKNGQIVLEGVDQRYRSNGSPTGQYSGFHDARARLVPWDDNLWQQGQREASEDRSATMLHRLSEVLERTSRDPEAAAEIWEQLPYELRRLVEES